jgi:flagellar biosynthetic protein FliR
MTEEFFLTAVGMFLIALIRFSGFFINMPGFGEGVMPMRVKAGVSGLCALIVLPHLLRTQTLPDLSVLGYGIMAVKELVMGLTMGFTLMVLMDTLRFAGEVIGLQIGFSFVQVVDPETNRSQGLVAEFMQIMGVLIFLIMGGHLLIIQAFVESFEIIPLAGLQMPPGIVAEVVRITSGLFYVGLKISMPLVGIILLGDVGLGIIARTVPRLNVFQVGFPIKILLGLWTITLIMPFLSDIIINLLREVYGTINTLLNHMH